MVELGLWATLATCLSIGFFWPMPGWAGVPPLVWLTCSWTLCVLLTGSLVRQETAMFSLGSGGLVVVGSGAILVSATTLLLLLASFEIMLLAALALLRNTSKSERAIEALSEMFL